MTTLAQGSSVTCTPRDNGSIAIATNGGFGSVTVTPTGGSASTLNFGPEPVRRVFGPYAEGASVVISNQSCNSLDYDAGGGGFDPSNVAITGGSIGGALVGTLAYVLAQKAVPVILPSSGSSNATGQITHTTALPYQPSGTVQVYLPAGVVVGDATGGLYSAIYSSTTVCQLVGSPATANAAYTQQTTLAALSAVTVPANSMGGNGCLRVTDLWTCANNANSKTFQTKLGATLFKNYSLTTSASLQGLINIRNRGNAASQVCNFSGAFGLSQAPSAPTLGTVDTTSAQVLTLYAQLAVATDYAILDGVTVEVLPAN